MNPTKDHDLTLGKWGPYNKQYFGACHIANEELGASFVLELFPAFYRRKIVSASTLIDGDVRMWGANVERTAFTYRYELEWKDKVYCDVTFNISDDKRVDVDCEFVNNADTPESLNMFLAAGLEYPTRSYGAVNVGNKKISVAKIVEGCVFIDALDYSDIKCGIRLAQDGKYLGEEEVDYATGKGTLLSSAAFKSLEHYVEYKVDSISSNSLGIRYRAEGEVNLSVEIEGEKHLLPLSKTDGYGYKALIFPERDVSTIRLFFDGKSADVDCLVIGKGATRAEFSPYEYSFLPTEKTVNGNSMTLKYRDSEYTYKIEWQQEPLMLRTLYTDDVGVMLHRTIHDHVNLERYDAKDPEGVYEVVRTNPIYLDAKSSKKISFSAFALKDGESEPKREEQCEYKSKPNRDGEAFAFSNDMMAYNVLLNVVYPIYTRRGYIRHSAPGRIWNCLYTWDSGLIGVGLSALDFKSAYENLKAYLTPVGDIHSPYIFHGSVVPTQLFLYHELVNRYPEKKKELAALYPRVMQYYNFVSNLSEDPNQTKDGLLKTWHIFYSSGGWDDYPPQKYTRFRTSGSKEKHNCMATPVITTAIAVLIAKIMKGISSAFGISENNALFDRDIERYSKAIQDNLWDEEAGYYSYLEHDDEGNPIGFLRYEDGTNFNMGLDGAYPYIAGISNEHQSARLLENIKCGMMTEYGVGVVDTRAPYYTPYGYWNGSVWMPHQWILAKALLDRGEADFSVKIAKTALKVWRREVERTYLCFEHFMSSNGRGAGFHQFSGLSSPILNFYSGLYVPGTVTAGFAAVVESAEWDKAKTSLKLAITSSSNDGKIIICMNDECKYKFTVNGKTARAKQVTNGAYVIPVGCGNVEILSHRIEK